MFFGRGRFGVRVRLLGLALLLASLLGSAWASQSASAAQIQALDAGVSVTQAGAHSDSSLKFSFVLEPGTIPPAGLFNPCGTLTGECMVVAGGAAKDIVVELPEGFLGNASAIPRCTSAELNSDACPASSQVGRATIQLVIAGTTLPSTTGVFNMVPARGEAARLGMPVGPVIVFTKIGLSGGPRPRLVATSENTVTLNPPASVDIKLWAIPNDPIHEPELRCPTGPGTCKASTVQPRIPFLANPTQCGVDGAATLRVNTYQQPNVWDEATSAPQQMTGCDLLSFRASMGVKPTVSERGKPTGLEVDLDIPQTWAQGNNPGSLAVPPLRDAVVTLPEGTSISPPSADGLAACADADLKLESTEPATCPAASKVGDVEVQTPLIPDLLRGGVYVRPQASNDPASGDMVRIAFEVRNDDRGIAVKVPGRIELDPETGQVTARFTDNPQLPFESLRMWFKSGPRAPLSLPKACGSHEAKATLTGWGAEDRPVELTMPFEVTHDGKGDPCPERGFDPGFQAGSVDATANGSSPFVMRLTRADDDEELSTLRDIELPEGLLGRVASVDLCPAQAADQGACPEGSRIGHVQVAAGTGPQPLWVPQAGKKPTAVYLSGPYKGAPYSLAIVVPAQAGPFDLGRVVVRSALHVDERTAQLSTGIDESRVYSPDGQLEQTIQGAMPQMLRGVPLSVREIRVIADRDGFMVNPTDCSQQQVAAQAVSVAGDTAALSSRYRATDCAALGFAPKFSARILDKGRKSTLKSFHPRTRFTVVPRPGDANIGGARVVLPSSTILDQSNIGTTCTRAQMAARDCPQKSVVGYAKAWSPLLNRPVEGPVYLAANGGVRPLPDLAAVLDGEIRVVLVGEVTTSRFGGKARLQNTFRVVPDAPVERFVLTMRGGKNRGLLVNSTDLCRTSERGSAVFTGQNGRVSRAALRLAPSFKGCAKARRNAARKAARKAAARKARKSAARAGR